MRRGVNLANIIVQSWSIRVYNDSGADGGIHKRAYKQDQHCEQHEITSVFDDSGVREGLGSKPSSGVVEKCGEAIGFHAVQYDEDTGG